MAGFDAPTVFSIGLFWSFKISPCLFLILQCMPTRLGPDLLPACHMLSTHILAGTTKKPKQKPFASISRAAFLGNKSGGATKNKQTTKQPKDNCTMLRCKWIEQFLPSCLYCYLAFLCCFSDVWKLRGYLCCYLIEWWYDMCEKMTEILYESSR